MRKHLKRYRLLGVLVATLVAFHGITIGTVHAQSSLRRISPSAITAQIYERLPELPLENQHINSETGSPDVENALVSRIIRYHLYTKDRPTNLRFDWKLTMADYLGAFERMSLQDYPDYGLQDNPIAEDIAAVANLDWEVRDHLTNLLYESFALSSIDSRSPVNSQ
ncbi:MAG: hypothetical protein AAF716_19645 [Cyanobacteria bacterium P01_D01_bin.1]